MDGFLNKQEDKGKFWRGKPSWKSRYFVLEGSTLSHYEPVFDFSGAPTGGVRGSIDVGGALVVDVDAELPFDGVRGDGRSLLFAVRRRDAREVLLQAETTGFKKLWLDALGAASRGEGAPNRSAPPLDCDGDYAALGLCAAGAAVAESARRKFADREIAAAYEAARAAAGNDGARRRRLKAARRSIAAARAHRAAAARRGRCALRGYATKAPGCVESQPIQDTFNVSVPERIFGGSLSSRREPGERIRTVQESWETSSI